MSNLLLSISLLAFNLLHSSLPVNDLPANEDFPIAISGNVTRQQLPPMQNPLQPPVQAQQPIQAPVPPLAPQAQAPQPGQQAIDPALQQAVDASEQAARAWVGLVDQGSYGNSWDAGALALRLVMHRKEWILSLETMRKPLGKPVNRKVADIRLAQDPKGLARGNYMIIIYETDFSSGHTAKEILTLQEINNGNWKVLTYLVSVIK